MSLSSKPPYVPNRISPDNLPPSCTFRGWIYDIPFCAHVDRNPHLVLIEEENEEEITECKKSLCPMNKEAKNEFQF